MTPRLAIALARSCPRQKTSTRTRSTSTTARCFSAGRGPEHRELHSGQRKTTGKDVQVACDLYGRLAWISDPIGGSRHDAHCIDESAVLIGFPQRSQIGDKRYVGNRMITLIKKSECRDLLDWENVFNTRVNKIWYLIDQVIANFKTWRIMHTDYRRRLDTFDTTISAVAELHFYRME